MTAVVVGLAGVVVGALLQAFTGFLSDRRIERREHRAWLRERIYETVLAFRKLSWTIEGKFQREGEPAGWDDPHEAERLFDQLAEAFGACKVMAGRYPTLSEAVSADYQTLYDWTQDLENDQLLHDHEIASRMLQVECNDFFKSPNPSRRDADYLVLQVEDDVGIKQSRVLRQYRWWERHRY